MKRLLVTVFLFFLFPLFGHGQHVIKDVAELSGFNAMPRERVLVHLNDKLLLAGENLYYSMYCLNATGTGLSEISKIAYLDLIASDGTFLFRHKILLKKGLGQGDFFVPPSVPTGNYKLIGYTRWMQNDGQSSFFEADLSIINPYFGLPDYESTDSDIEVENSQTIETSQPTISSSSNEIEATFALIPDKETYSKRSPVAVHIKSSDFKGVGSFSVSVRKKHNVNNGSVASTHSFVANFPLEKKLARFQLNDTVYLPELRGELLSGTLISKKDGLPKTRENINLSISGNQGVFQIVQTNENGRFYFSLDDSPRDTKTYVRVLGNDTNDNKILWDFIPSINYKHLNFPTFSTTEEINSMLRERSIYNQIESAYITQKRDSTLQPEVPLPFHKRVSESYVLDDYNRFSTLRETMVEIIQNAFIRKIGEEDVIQVRSPNSYLVEDEARPLVMVDGILAKDISKLIAYNSKKIERIDIYQNEIHMGPKRYQGMVAVYTKDQDFFTSNGSGFNSELSLSVPLPIKKYYYQEYESLEKNKRIPDFRNQLFWLPNLVINKEETSFVFYTSDNTGAYEIHLKGVTKAGLEVSLTKIIHVE